MSRTRGQRGTPIEHECCVSVRLELVYSLNGAESRPETDATFVSNQYLALASGRWRRTSSTTHGHAFMEVLPSTLEQSTLLFTFPLALQVLYKFFYLCRLFFFNFLHHIFFLYPLSFTFFLRGPELIAVYRLPLFIFLAFAPVTF